MIHLDFKCVINLSTYSLSLSDVTYRINILYNVIQLCKHSGLGQNLSLNSNFNVDGTIQIDIYIYIVNPLIFKFAIQDINNIYISIFINKTNLVGVMKDPESHE